MLTRWLQCSAPAFVSVLLACSSSSSPEDSGSAGSSSGGQPAAAGAPAQVAGGGSTAAGGSSAGSSSVAGGAAGGAGGAGAAGGSTASGGTAGSGTAGSGTAGSASGGAGGSIAGAGTGGSSAGNGAGGGSAGGGGKPAPDPSGGCGKASPMTGSSGSPLNVSSHQYYVKLPTGYMASKPYPLLFVFNPTGNPLSWAETSAGFESNGAKDAAIRVYPGPSSMASGWGAGDVSFFVPLYNQVIGNFCVDKARVFATGESSGGDFSSILGCEHANLLRATAPCATKNVNNYPLDATKRKCTGQVAAVVIHGKNDNVVGPENGPKTRDFYRTLNHCADTSTPVTGYTDTKSNCVQFDGCDANYPVYWCQHTDPNYSGTNHGWPVFAPKMLWGLFSSY